MRGNGRRKLPICQAVRTARETIISPTGQALVACRARSMCGSAPTACPYCSGLLSSASEHTRIKARYPAGHTGRIPLFLREPLSLSGGTVIRQLCRFNMARPSFL